MQDDARDGSDADVLEDYVLSEDEGDEAAPAAVAEKTKSGHRRSGKKVPAGKAAAGNSSRRGPAKGSTMKAKKLKRKR